MENKIKSKLIKAVAVLMVIIMTVCAAPLGALTQASNPFATVAEAAEETSGIFTYSVKGGKATIIGVDFEAKGAVKIPSKLGGYPVTAIGELAFVFSTAITSVTIPDSVETIGDGAFSSCYLLKSVTIGKGLKKMEGNPFSACEALKKIEISKDNPNYSVDENGIIFNKDKTELLICPAAAPLYTYTVPDGVKTIGKSAFSYNRMLSSVTLPASVTKVEDEAFYGCYMLETVTATDNLYMVGTDAFTDTALFTSTDNDLVYVGSAVCGFSGETYPKKITIKDGTKGIAAGAFMMAIDASEVYIPESVIYIGSSGLSAGFKTISVNSENKYYMSDSEGVLYTKDQKTLIAYPSERTSPSYTVSDKTETIGEGAFSFATYLRMVTLPDSVKKIEQAAFTFSMELVTVNMSKNLVELGEGAFVLCSSLESINIPDGVKTIKPLTFSGCTSLKSVKLGKNVSKIGESAFSSCYELKKISLSGKIKTIESNAFSDCVSLKNVVIGKNVKTIKGNPFTGCEALKKFKVDSQNKYFKVDGYGVLFNKKGTKLIAYPDGRTSTVYSVPKTVTAIGNEAFAYNKKLKTVSLSEKTKTIGEMAFAYCEQLEKISFTEVVTIQKDAFSYCENLENIYLSAKLKTVADGAFDGCEDLSDIYYGGTKAQWKKIDVSEYNDMLKSAEKHYSHKHNYGKGKVASKATYTRDGYKLYTCDECDCVKTTSIDRLKLEKVSLDTVKSSKKKQMTVTWNAVSDATGYEIVYSTSKKFTDKTTNKATVNKQKTEKTTVKKLKSGKKYFVKVRAYKTVSGTKVYGAYSKVMSVKAK